MNKPNIQDIVYNISTMAYYARAASVLFCNAEANNYVSGELADGIDDSIADYCKEIVKEIMPLL